MLCPAEQPAALADSARPHSPCLITGPLYYEANVNPAVIYPAPAPAPAPALVPVAEYDSATATATATATAVFASASASESESDPEPQSEPNSVWALAS